MKTKESIYSTRIAGILAPLFALRGKYDLGIGDTAALCEMIAWCAQHGFQALQMLPIHETSSSNSPYEILSAMALEPSTITTHPDWIPDLTEQDYHSILKHYDIKKMQQETVQYSLVKACKQELLKAAHSRFQQRNIQEKRIQEYHDFQKKESYWLANYTLYRALLEHHGNQEDFSLWNPSAQNATSAKRWLENLLEAERRHLDERRDFFSYTQWIAITQWKKVFSTAASFGVSLIGDIPIGVHVASADVFAHPELFDTKQFGGAPPETIFQSDPFTMQWGQNWGVPLYKWDQMEKDNFQWWRERIKFLKSFFHFLRVDHALGLFRIYSFPWPPKRNHEFLSLGEVEARRKTNGILPHFTDYADDTPEHRKYNEERGTRLLRIFQEEAGPENLIAEDLGEAPCYVPHALETLNIPGFKIPLWVRDQEQKIIPACHYPIISVATYSTHDHEPMRQQWETWQNEIQNKTPRAPSAEKNIRELLNYIGLARIFHTGSSRGAANPDLDKEGDGLRRRLDVSYCPRSNSKLTQDPSGFPASTGDQYEIGGLTPYSETIHQALLKTLYESSSWLVIVMITDLFGLKKTFNKPGNNAQSNWVERMKLPISQWNENYASILVFSDQALRESGRFLRHDEKESSSV
jgi:4-alpha-glucanotransferase